jgi:hypothetical protein
MDYDGLQYSTMDLYDGFWFMDPNTVLRLSVCCPASISMPWTVSIEAKFNATSFLIILTLDSLCRIGTLKMSGSRAQHSKTYIHVCTYLCIYMCVCNIATHQTWYKREHWLSEVTWFHDVHNPSRPHLQHGLLVLLFCRLSYVIPLVLKRTLSVSVQICQPSTQEQPAIGWPCMPNVAGLHIKRKGHCRTFLHRSVSMWLCVPVPEGHAVPRAYSAQSS